MDQQTVDKYANAAVKIVREAIERAYAENTVFTVIAMLLATMSPNGYKLDTPVLLSVTPMCIQPELSTEQFVELLRQVARESNAAAVVIGLYAATDEGTPGICVEKRGSWQDSIGMRKGVKWEWTSMKAFVGVPILPINLTN